MGFKEDVEGKNVLIVGGGLSSEDLALMAIKEGVSNVYITFRGFDGEVAETTRWPFDKVTCYPSTQITCVNGQEITLSGVYYDDDFVVDPETEETVLRNIDTIIFCTGYEKNVKYLDEALQSPLRLTDEGRMTIPSDWSMGDGDILPDKYKGIRPENDEVFIPQSFYYYSDNLYKNAFCIDNPNMMYMIEYGDSPLNSLEIKAWMLSRVVSSQIALPSPEQMRAEEKEILLEYLKCPMVRYWSDWKYQETMDDARDKDELYFGTWNEHVEDQLRDLECRILGETMNRFQYPVSFIKPDNKTFTDYYHAMMVAWNGDSRYLCEIEYDTTKEVDGWRSFRDYPGITKIRSYFTGIHAKLLPKPWVELDGSEKLW